MLKKRRRVEVERREEEPMRDIHRETLSGEEEEAPERRGGSQRALTSSNVDGYETLSLPLCLGFTSTFSRRSQTQSDEKPRRYNLEKHRPPLKRSFLKALLSVSLLQTRGGLVQRLLRVCRIKYMKFISDVRL